VTSADPSLQALRRCATGHADGLEELFDRHGDQVFRLCLHLLRLPQEAEDATQDIFLRVLDRAASFQERSQVATWIRRITVNHCLNLLERRKRQPLSLVDEEQAPAASAVADPSAMEEQEVAAEVRALIDRLPEEGRLVFVLREIEGLSYREMAEVLDLPAGTVMSRLSRARDRFRQLAGPTARSLGIDLDED
jgi:RNA polymerase sigma-70 factor (ECF subfamily)